MHRALQNVMLGMLLGVMVSPGLAIAEKRAVQKWEHKVIRAGDFTGGAPGERLDEWQSYMEGIMDQQGQDGWELVSVDRSDGLVMFFFKRPHD